MASSNPFRRKAAPAAGAPASTTPTPHTEHRSLPLDALDTFSAASTPPSRLDTLPDRNTGPEARFVEVKTKPIKKVRVLSPPPLSPDSPEWPVMAPLSSVPTATGTGDPFDGASSDDSDHEIIQLAPPPLPGQRNNSIPGNPFSKTLRDMESGNTDDKLIQERREEGDALKIANKARRSLDVSSFQRLLMTGKSDSEPSDTPKPVTGALTFPETDKNPAFSGHGTLRDEPTPDSRHQEVPLVREGLPDAPEDELDEEGLSDSSTVANIGIGKKAPPPPSSRHGKSIKLELEGDQGAQDTLRPRSASDLSKPLPPTPPRRSFEEEPEVAQTTTGSAKKSVPAPPPRRGHGRAESKAAYDMTGFPTHGIHKAQDDDPSSHSSSDRNRSEPHTPAPPPPPRRSHHGSKNSVQVSSNTLSSVGLGLGQSSPSPVPSSDSDRPAGNQPTITEPQSTSESHSGMLKPSAPPPPPPARNTSVRRPASVRSMESSSRKTSAETKSHGGIAPPPPPRRQRGSSKGSMDGPHRTVSGTVEQSDLASPPVAATEHNSGTTMAAADSSKGSDILADLDTLQREVDALRGKLG